MVVKSSDFMLHYYQNEILECDWLEQELKNDFDFQMHMLQLRRDAAKEFLEEISAK